MGQCNMGVFRCTEMGGCIIGSNAMCEGYYTVGNNAMYNSRGLRKW